MGLEGHVKVTVPDGEIVQRMDGVGSATGIGKVHKPNAPATASLVIQDLHKENASRSLFREGGIYAF